MTWPIAFVIALLVFPCAGFANNAPDVSRADRGPITRAYGTKIASRVFSNEFAGTRADALKKSGANIPGFDCNGDRLSALIEALPYPVSPQATSWVERYLVDYEPRARRNLMLFFGKRKITCDRAPARRDQSRSAPPARRDSASTDRHRRREP